MVEHVDALDQAPKLTFKISSSVVLEAVADPYEFGTTKPVGPLIVSVHDNTVVTGLHTLAGLALVDEITGRGT